MTTHFFILITATLLVASCFLFLTAHALVSPEMQQYTGVWRHVNLPSQSDTPNPFLKDPASKKRPQGNDDNNNNNQDDTENKNHFFQRRKKPDAAAVARPFISTDRTAGAGSGGGGGGDGKNLNNNNNRRRQQQQGLGQATQGGTFGSGAASTLEQTAEQRQAEEQDPDEEFNVESQQLHKHDTDDWPDEEPEAVHLNLRLDNLSTLLLPSSSSTKNQQEGSAELVWEKDSSENESNNDKNNDINNNINNIKSKCRVRLIAADLNVNDEAGDDGADGDSQKSDKDRQLLPQALELACDHLDAVIHAASRKAIEKRQNAENDDDDESRGDKNSINKNKNKKKKKKKKRKKIDPDFDPAVPPFRFLNWNETAIMYPIANVIAVIHETKSDDNNNDNIKNQNLNENRRIFYDGSSSACVETIPISEQSWASRMKFSSKKNKNKKKNNNNNNNVPIKIERVSQSVIRVVVRLAQNRKSFSSSSSSSSSSECDSVTESCNLNNNHLLPVTSVSQLSKFASLSVRLTLVPLGSQSPTRRQLVRWLRFPGVHSTPPSSSQQTQHNQQQLSTHDVDEEEEHHQIIAEYERAEHPSPFFELRATEQRLTRVGMGFRARLRRQEQNSPQKKKKKSNNNKNNDNTNSTTTATAPLFTTWSVEVFRRVPRPRVECVAMFSRLLSLPSLFQRASSAELDKLRQEKKTQQAGKGEERPSLADDTDPFSDDYDEEDDQQKQKEAAEQEKEEEAVMRELDANGNDNEAQRKKKRQEDKNRVRRLQEQEEELIRNVNGLPSQDVVEQSRMELVSAHQLRGVLDDRFALPELTRMSPATSVPTGPAPEFFNLHYDHHENEDGKQQQEENEENELLFKTRRLPPRGLFVLYVSEERQREHTVDVGITHADFSFIAPLKMEKRLVSHNITFAGQHERLPLPVPPFANWTWYDTTNVSSSKFAPGLLGTPLPTQQQKNMKTKRAVKFSHPDPAVQREIELRSLIPRLLFQFTNSSSAAAAPVAATASDEGDAEQQQQHQQEQKEQEEDEDNQQDKKTRNDDAAAASGGGGGAQGFSIVLEQSRPIDDLVVWVADGKHDTLFVDDEAQVPFTVRSHKHDALNDPLFGWRFALDSQRAFALDKLHVTLGFKLRRRDRRRGASSFVEDIFSSSSSFLSSSSSSSSSSTAADYAEALSHWDQASEAAVHLIEWADRIRWVPLPQQNQQEQKQETMKTRLPTFANYLSIQRDEAVAVSSCFSYLHTTKNKKNDEVKLALAAAAGVSDPNFFFSLSDKLGVESDAHSRVWRLTAKRDILAGEEILTLPWSATLRHSQAPAWVIGIVDCKAFEDVLRKHDQYVINSDHVDLDNNQNENDENENNKKKNSRRYRNFRSTLRQRRLAHHSNYKAWAILALMHWAQVEPELATADHSDWHQTSASVRWHAHYRMFNQRLKNDPARLLRVFVTSKFMMNKKNQNEKVEEDEQNEQNEQVVLDTLLNYFDSSSAENGGGGDENYYNRISSLLLNDLPSPTWSPLVDSLLKREALLRDLSSYFLKVHPGLASVVGGLDAADWFASAFTVIEARALLVRNKDARQVEWLYIPLLDLATPGGGGSNNNQQNNNNNNNEVGNSEIRFVRASHNDGTIAFQLFSSSSSSSSKVIRAGSPISFSGWSGNGMRSLIHGIELFGRVTARMGFAATAPVLLPFGPSLTAQSATRAAVLDECALRCKRIADGQGKISVADHRGAASTLQAKSNELSSSSSSSSSSFSSCCNANDWLEGMLWRRWRQIAAQELYWNLGIEMLNRIMLNTGLASLPHPKKITEQQQQKQQKQQQKSSSPPPPPPMWKDTRQHLVTTTLRLLERHIEEISPSVNFTALSMHERIERVFRGAATIERAVGLEGEERDGTAEVDVKLFGCCQKSKDELEGKDDQDL